uniref:Uncharacterized protein n=1 Tax=Manihot esculenta TaxID=3983 RepID=A0A2C9UM19_MANES
MCLCFSCKKHVSQTFHKAFLLLEKKRKRNYSQAAS